MLSVMYLSLRASSYVNSTPLFTSTIVAQSLESKNPGSSNLKNNNTLSGKTEKMVKVIVNVKVEQKNVF